MLSSSERTPRLFDVRRLYSSAVFLVSAALCDRELRGHVWWYRRRVVSDRRGIGEGRMSPQRPIFSRTRRVLTKFAPSSRRALYILCILQRQYFTRVDRERWRRTIIPLSFTFRRFAPLSHLHLESRRFDPPHIFLFSLALSQSCPFLASTVLLDNPPRFLRDSPSHFFDLLYTFLLLTRTSRLVTVRMIEYPFLSIRDTS
jgi:hypothetical protein